MSTGKIRVELQYFGECPQCGLGLEVGCINGEPHTVSHLLPMCKAFRDMTANKFLLFVLDFREKQREEV